MIIEKATRRDAEEILALWIELAEYHAALDSVFALSESGPDAYARFLLDMIDSEEALVLAAREIPGGTIEGFAMARVMHDPPVFARMPRGEIIDCYVRPRLRRLGMGTAMLSEIESWFMGQGITRLEVRVYRGNPIGYPFWEKSGFGPYLDTLALEIAGQDSHE